MKLFDHIDNVTLKKNDLTEDEMKTYSPYMMNRFISMIDMYLPIINQLNQYDLPKDTHNTFLKSFLPKRKQYIKYISSKKDNKSYDLECLEKYFEVGRRDAEHFLSILSDEQLKEITDKFKTLKGRV